MRKFLITTFLLSLNVYLHAQGWVIDEASKDNSGGIFSGVFGLLLFFGMIWLIGYIVHKKKEYKKKGTRSTNNHFDSSAELKGISSKPIINKLNKNTISGNGEEKQDKDVADLIPKKDSCYICYRVIKEKEYADIIHYSDIFKDGFTVESYGIRNEDIVYENTEHHGVNINNIRENGYKISKQEFEKWQKRIDNIKLKLEQLFPGHRTPYCKEWKDGDYLYYPDRDILAEINKKYAENNNIAYTEKSVVYQGPEFSLLHVTNADKESPEGFHISISEDYASYDNEEDGPKSLKYYVPYYQRASLISKKDYEKALALIKTEFKELMQDIRKSIT